MAFKLGNFLKKALNPFAPVKGAINAIKNKDLKGFAAATIPGVGATQSALQGDWKGAFGRMANPMGEMASAADRLGMPKPPPAAMGNTAQAMEALNSAAGDAGMAQPGGEGGGRPQIQFGDMTSLGGGGTFKPMQGFGGGMRRRPSMSFGGGMGSFGGGGGMDEGLRKIIQDYYAKQRGGGGMGGGTSLG